MKLYELLNVWLNKYIKHTIKLRTYVTYQNLIRIHISPFLGEYEIDSLTTAIIQDFITYKIEYGNIKTGKALSYNTVNSIISVLKQVLKLALKLEYINKDITENISPPHSKERKIEVFNSQEQQLLESYCLNHKANYIGVILCLYTGIRIGELLALTWDDIDFNNQLLTINKNVCSLKINGILIRHISEPKTKSSLRVIPIPKQLLSYLKKNKTFIKI